MSMPRRKNTTLMPVSWRASETKPSADISSVNPKWVVRNRAEAATSSTFSDTAEAVIFMGTPGRSAGPGQSLYYVQSTTYNNPGGVPDSVCSYRRRRSGPHPATAVARPRGRVPARPAAGPDHRPGRRRGNGPGRRRGPGRGDDAPGGRPPRRGADDPLHLRARQGGTAGPDARRRLPADAPRRHHRAALDPAGRRDRRREPGPVRGPSLGRGHLYHPTAARPRPDGQVRA